MDSEPKKLKGILKKPSGSTPPSTSLTPPTAQAEAKRIALQHANILEQRKEMESEVFEAIETLTEFPATRNAGFSSSSNPAPNDVEQFKELVRLFQPGDYDDLIEERNIQGHCGYALCEKPKRSYEGGGEFKFVNTGKADFGIVRRKELEQWCSEKCARRALYIKVQLNETPAWERIGLPDLPIELLEEDQAQGGDPVDGVAQDLRQLTLEQKQKAAEDSAALALERGDDAAARPGRKIDLTIREKSVTTEAKPPELEPSEQEQDGHKMLEGYKSRFGG